MLHPLLLPVVQSELQPSPSTVLPSSHCSPATLILSPQIFLHVALVNLRNPLAHVSHELSETGQSIQFASTQVWATHAVCPVLGLNPILQSLHVSAVELAHNTHSTIVSLHFTHAFNAEVSYDTPVV